MPAATKYRDRPHARIYFARLELPAWRELSLAARCLLTEMLARYRPGENGRLEWPVRRVAEVLGVSKSTAATALNELETIGWIEVTRVGNFSRKGRSSLYALATVDNDVTGEPATRAFERWRPDGSRPLGSRCRVSKQARTVRSEVQDSLPRDEKLSAHEDTQRPSLAQGRPDIGTWVVYIARPGEGRSGKSEFPACVMHHEPDGESVTLMVVYDVDDMGMRPVVREATEDFVWPAWRYIKTREEEKFEPSRPNHIRRDLDRLQEGLDETILALYGGWERPDKSFVDLMASFEKMLKDFGKRLQVLEKHAGPLPSV